MFRLGQNFAISSPSPPLSVQYPHEYECMVSQKEKGFSVLTELLSGEYLGSNQKFSTSLIFKIRGG